MSEQSIDTLDLEDLLADVTESPTEEPTEAPSKTNAPTRVVRQRPTRRPRSVRPKQTLKPKGKITWTSKPTFWTAKPTFWTAKPSFTGTNKPYILATSVPLASLKPRSVFVPTTAKPVKPITAKPRVSLTRKPYTIRPKSVVVTTARPRVAALTLRPFTTQPTSSSLDTSSPIIATPRFAVYGTDCSTPAPECISCQYLSLGITQTFYGVSADSLASDFNSVACAVGYFAGISPASVIRPGAAFRASLREDVVITQYKLNIPYGGTGGYGFSTSLEAYNKIKTSLSTAVDGNKDFSAFLNAMSEVPVYSSAYLAPVYTSGLIIDSYVPDTTSSAKDFNTKSVESPMGDPAFTGLYIFLITLACAVPTMFLCWCFYRRESASKKTNVAENDIAPGSGYAVNVVKPSQEILNPNQDREAFERIARLDTTATVDGEKKVFDNKKKEMQLYFL